MRPAGRGRCGSFRSSRAARARVRARSRTTGSTEAGGRAGMVAVPGLMIDPGGPRGRAPQQGQGGSSSCRNSKVRSSRPRSSKVLSRVRRCVSRRCRSSRRRNRPRPSRSSPQAAGNHTDHANDIGRADWLRRRGVGGHECGRAGANRAEGAAGAAEGSIGRWRAGLERLCRRAVVEEVAHGRHEGLCQPRPEVSRHAGVQHVRRPGGRPRRQGRLVSCGGRAAAVV